MAFTPSNEQLLQQVESLKKELDECRKAIEITQSNEFRYRSLVESANEAILVAQAGIFPICESQSRGTIWVFRKRTGIKTIDAFYSSRRQRFGDGTA